MPGRHCESECKYTLVLVDLTGFILWLTTSASDLLLKRCFGETKLDTHHACDSLLIINKALGGKRQSYNGLCTLLKNIRIISHAFIHRGYSRFFLYVINFNVYILRCLFFLSWVTNVLSRDMERDLLHTYQGMC